MESSNRLSAMITGASMGLGFHYAQLFAERGHDVVLVARSEDKLEALAERLRREHSVQATVLGADLADPGAPARLFDQLAERKIELGYLVNNAGFGTNGSFWEQDHQRQLDMIQVNVTALTALTHLALPSMIERGFGRVLNVASTAGFQAGPLMSVYYATKAFVILFSEGLAVELKGTGVTVTAHCPGATATHFGAVAGSEGTLLFKLSTADPGAVARHGYSAMESGAIVAIPGFLNKLIMQSLRISPRALVRHLSHRLVR